MRYLSMFLVLCSVIFADIGAIVGGSSSAVSNGIFFNADVLTAAQNTGTNGAALDSNSGGTTENNAGSVQIRDVGQFTNTVIGNYIRVDFFDVYTPAYLEVIARTDDTVLTNIVFSSTGTVTSWSVGGACPIIGAGHSFGDFDLQDVVDDNLSSAASNKVKIFVTGSADISTMIQLDTGPGTTDFSKSILAANSSYVYTPGGSTLTATAAITAIFQFAFGANSYVQIKGFTLNGGGSANAQYGIFVSTASDDHITFADLTITNVLRSPGAGMWIEGDLISIVNCEFSDCAVGFSTGSSDGQDSQMVSCSSHDNTGNGYLINGNRFSGVKSLAYANGTNGFEFGTSADGFHADHCTSFGNTEDGYKVLTGATEASITNCVASGNGSSFFGYRLPGNDAGNLLVFSYNHSNDTQKSSDTGTWATLGDGNNIEGDPKFENVTPASEDFGYQDDSPCIRAGMLESDLGVGSNDSVAGGGGGGGQPVINGAVIR